MFVYLIKWFKGKGSSEVTFVEQRKTTYCAVDLLGGRCCNKTIQLGYEEGRAKGLNNLDRGGLSSAPWFLILYHLTHSAKWFYLHLLFMKWPLGHAGSKETFCTVLITRLLKRLRSPSGRDGNVAGWLKHLDFIPRWIAYLPFSLWSPVEVRWFDQLCVNGWMDGGMAYKYI